MSKAKIAALEEEMKLIYLADLQYWRQDPNQTREARLEYQRRQDRLKEIRRELADLRFNS